MASLLYSEGDIFDTLKNQETKTLLPHVVNNQGAWGAGFVVPLGRAYPKAKESYLTFSKNKTLDLGQTDFVEVADNVVVCNMVAQTLGGSRPLRYDALVHCMLQVANYASINRVDRIDCPLFGAGLAGGSWPFIHKLVQDCWTARNINVTVHYMRDKSPPGFLEWFEQNYVGEHEGGVEVQP